MFPGIRWRNQCHSNLSPINSPVHSSDINSRIIVTKEQNCLQKLVRKFPMQSCVVAELSIYQYYDEWDCVPSFRIEYWTAEFTMWFVCTTLVCKGQVSWLPPCTREEGVPSLCRGMVEMLDKLLKLLCLSLCTSSSMYSKYCMDRRQLRVVDWGKNYRLPLQTHTHKTHVLYCVTFSLSLLFTQPSLSSSPEASVDRIPCYILL